MTHGDGCICPVFGMIEDAVRGGADTLQAVMDATGAGRGCGKCGDFLKYLIQDIREEMGKEKKAQRDQSGICEVYYIGTKYY